MLDQSVTRSSRSFDEIQGDIKNLEQVNTTFGYLTAQTLRYQIHTVFFLLKKSIANAMNVQPATKQKVEMRTITLSIRFSF